MRIRPVAGTRKLRALVTTAAAAAVVGGTTILSAGTAAAATVTADDCTTVIGGRVGDTVVVDGESVSELVRQGAREAKTVIVVHDLTIWPNHLARKISGAQLEVGTIPDSRSGAVKGDTIATAVREALDGVAGLGVLRATQTTTLDTIAKKVAGNCALTVEATDYSPPKTSTPREHAPDADRSRGGTESTRPESGASSDSRSATDGGDSTDGGLHGTGDARAERRDYGGIPAAEAPGAGIAVPGDLRYAPANGIPDEATTPRYGVLDGERSGSSGHGSTDDVRDAGNADTLAADEQRQAVQLPMLLAVVALAAVTAALVRTWVLRRAS